MTYSDGRELCVGHDQAVAADEPKQTGIDTVRGSAIMRVLQDHLRTNVTDFKHAPVEIIAPGKPDLVYLKSGTLWQTYPLLAREDRFPPFIA